MNRTDGTRAAPRRSARRLTPAALVLLLGAALLPPVGAQTDGKAKPRPPAATPAPAGPSAGERAQQLVESARQQLQAGQAAQALATAQQARRLDPRDYKAVYYVAYALMTLGEYEPALEAQKQSLELASSDAARTMVASLGEAIGARRGLAEADAALNEGLYAKAARLYTAAYDAGVPQAEVGLKAAQLHEQRLNDLPTAARLLRAVAQRHGGTPAADKATAELARLKPALAALAQQKLRSAQEFLIGTRRGPLEEALALDPGNRDILIALAHDAAAAADWPMLESRLKTLQQKGWLEDALRYRRVDLAAWDKDARVATLLEDAWGPAKAKEVLASRGNRDCAACPEMVSIPAGSFLMGSPADEAQRRPTEGPQRRVTVRAFELGRTEVTQAQWRAVMGGNPSQFSGCDDCPVENVSWDDARIYVQKLTAMAGRTYRLPTEAEWEYAARAGTQTPFSFGAMITTDQANFNGRDYSYNGSPKGQARARTSKVASFPANAFGLHDMHGNVWEWVEDCHVVGYDTLPLDGSAQRGGDCNSRLLRGGGWENDPVRLRSASRAVEVTGKRSSIIGLRVAAAAR